MKKYGLIGEKLGHSFSPLIHAKFADYQYDLIETPLEGLEDVLRNEEYGGFNVTIPYKTEVMKYLDEISDIAKKIGAVNTIVRTDDGKLCGYNTDYFGFTYLLDKMEVDVEGLKCIVLGSGGASKTVQTALKDLGAREVVVISRTGENNYQNLHLHKDADFIVNTTPVGMYPDNGKKPLSISEFNYLKGVVDLIYNPYRTKIVLEAMVRDIPAKGGMGMLVGQAREAVQLFLNEEIEDERMDDVLDEIKRETLNQILIGMPGSGKTTLGREMAEHMGREFIDIDEMIEEREGMSIPEIFEHKGENYFRDLETKMLEEICVKTGLVIATGGGVVKRSVNYYILKQNAVLIWIKRDLDKLEKAGRPLSMSTPIEKLYEERKPIYSLWSDYYINNKEK